MGEFVAAFLCRKVNFYKLEHFGWCLDRPWRALPPDQPECKELTKNEKKRKHKSFKKKHNEKKRKKKTVEKSKNENENPKTMKKIWNGQNLLRPFVSQAELYKLENFCWLVDVTIDRPVRYL